MVERRENVTTIMPITCNSTYQTSTECTSSTHHRLPSDTSKLNEAGAPDGGPSHYSERIQRMIEHQGEFSSEVDFRTAFSRDHWTEPEPLDHFPAGREDQQELLTAEVLANLEEKWGHSVFLVKNLVGVLSMGRKIAEGGQAEIFEALLGKRSCRLIAKVFKGNSLSSLQHQWPTQIFELEGICKYISRVFGGVLLDNRRYAFLMLLYPDDLRSVIDKRMMRSNNRGPPFEATEALHYMIRIACGMKSLHSKGILHRDLKASNVLVWACRDDEFYCAVADYECSIGVLGTRFWRAPEVLQAIQSRCESGPEFTTKADVYSYAMTCFEILTGHLPFEDHNVTDYDLVISGERPELPSHASGRMRDLLSRCWHSTPDERPEFSEIVQLVGVIMVTELNVPQQIVKSLTKARSDTMPGH